MPIRKSEVVVVDEFSQVRNYTDSELRDFHRKIQRFYEPRKIQDPESKYVGQVFSILNYDELGVAYGAFSKTIGQNGIPYYRVVAKERIVMKNRVGENYLDTEHPTRYEQFHNLMEQYEGWRRKQDWVEDKQMENLEQMAEEAIPF